jgi:hypothetical protein
VRRRETPGDAVTDGQCIRTVHCDGDHPKADGVSNVHRCIVVIAFEHAVTAEKTFVLSAPARLSSPGDSG